LKVLAAGEIKPVVAERIPMLEAARAHELLERGGHAGKVVNNNKRVDRSRRVVHQTSACSGYVVNTEKSNPGRGISGRRYKDDGRQI